jgi:hypothetical protein
MDLGVTDGVKQLANVDAASLKSGDIKLPSLKRLAPEFQGTFKSLLTVMRIEDNRYKGGKEKEDAQAVFSTQIVSSTIPGGHKRLASLDASSLRLKEGEDRARPHLRTSESPKTPDKPTHPEDPNYSGASNESKDEEYAKALISRFLEDTMSVLEDGFAKIKWQNSGYDVHICGTFFPSTVTPNTQSER